MQPSLDQALLLKAVHNGHHRAGGDPQVFRDRLLGLALSLSDGPQEGKLAGLERDRCLEVSETPRRLETQLRQRVTHALGRRLGCRLVSLRRSGHESAGYLPDGSGPG